MIFLPLLVATVMYISVVIKKKFFENVFIGKITHILEPKITTSVLGVAIG